MEIRFYDVEREEYVDLVGLSVDKWGNVLQVCSHEPFSYIVLDNIKPHIYIAGRRVA